MFRFLWSGAPCRAPHQSNPVIAREFPPFSAMLQCYEIFDQVGLLPCGEPEGKETIVVRHHVGQRRT
jgi:hypothetical protein